MSYLILTQIGTASQVDAICIAVGCYADLCDPSVDYDGSDAADDKRTHDEITAEGRE